MTIPDGPPQLTGRDFTTGRRHKPDPAREPCDFCWVCEQFVSLVRLQPACGPHCLPKDTQ